MESLWNTFWNPYHTILKRIMYSVSRKNWKICETEYEFCFRKVWNGLQNPFQKVSNFFLKRIPNSVSHFSEMEFVFRFTNFKFFSWNGIRDSFQKNLKRIPKAVSSSFMFFFRKRILGSVSYVSETNQVFRFCNF